MGHKQLNEIKSKIDLTFRYFTGSVGITQFHVHSPRRIDNVLQVNECVRNATDCIDVLLHGSNTSECEYTLGVIVDSLDFRRVVEREQIVIQVVIWSLKPYLGADNVIVFR